MRIFTHGWPSAVWQRVSVEISKFSMFCFERLQQFELQKLYLSIESKDFELQAIEKDK